MKTRLKKTRRAAVVMTDPKPAFVSLVPTGANNAPFVALRADEDVAADAVDATTGATDATEAETEATRADGTTNDLLDKIDVNDPALPVTQVKLAEFRGGMTDISRVTFDGKRFPDEAAAVAWCEAAGFEDYTVTRDDDGVTTVSANEQPEFADAAAPVALEAEGVTLWVGVLANPSDEAVEALRSEEVAGTVEVIEPVAEIPAPVAEEVTAERHYDEVCAVSAPPEVTQLRGVVRVLVEMARDTAWSSLWEKASAERRALAAELVGHAEALLPVLDRFLALDVADTAAVVEQAAETVAEVLAESEKAEAERLAVEAALAATRTDAHFVALGFSAERAAFLSAQTPQEQDRLIAEWESSEGSNATRTDADVLDAPVVETEAVVSGEVVDGLPAVELPALTGDEPNVEGTSEAVADDRIAGLDAKVDALTKTLSTLASALAMLTETKPSVAKVEEVQATTVAATRSTRTAAGIDDIAAAEAATSAPKASDGHSDRMFRAGFGLT